MSAIEKEFTTTYGKKFKKLTNLLRVEIGKIRAGFATHIPEERDHQKPGMDLIFWEALYQVAEEGRLEAAKKVNK